MDLTAEQAQELYDNQKFISFRFKTYDPNTGSYYHCPLGREHIETYAHQFVELEEAKSMATTNYGYGYHYDRDFLKYSLKLSESTSQSSLYMYLRRQGNNDATDFAEFLGVINQYPQAYQYYLGDLTEGNDTVNVCVFLDLEVFIKVYQETKYLPKNVVKLIQKYATNQYKIYKLRDCSDEAEYEPIHPQFRLKLFDYQKQSLTWMSQIENQNYLFLAPKSSYYKLADKAYVALVPNHQNADVLTNNYVFENEYPTTEMIRCRGGLLCDEMGNGKTITCIALIVHNRGLVPPLLTSIVERETYVASKATLIITPTNIVTQWESEIQKCLGGQNGGLRILKITNKAQMNKYTMADVVSADIILTSYDWLSHANHIGTGFVKKGKSAEFLANQKQDKILHGENYHLYRKSTTLVFIKYHRILYDEFHEEIKSVSSQNIILHLIRHCLKAKNIWGISGTPLLGDEEIVSNIPHMLQIRDSQNQIYGVDVVSQHTIFDRYVRRNEKRHLSPITYQVVHIRQSIQEKQLYDSCKSQPLETLIQLCCYHNLGGHDSRSIDDVAKLQDTARQTQKTDLESQIKDLTLNLQQIENVLRSMNPQIRHVSELNYLIDAKHPQHNHALTQQIANSPTLQLQVQSLRQYHKYEQQVSNRQIDLQKLQTCIDYYNQTLKTSLSTGQFICPITGESVGAGEVVITPDGHLFSKQAIEILFEGVDGNKAISCPITGKPLMRSEITIVTNPATDQEALTSNQRVFGSKIATIIDQIQAFNPNDKVIIFSRWDNLLHTIGYALNHNRIGHVYIRGQVGSRDKAIRDFQTDPKIKAILLSADYGASGVNLIEANHVFIVHPFIGDNGLQYEKQAIGRAWRTGQTRPVKVSFFLTENTIEEEIYNKHRKHCYVSTSSTITL